MTKPARIAACALSAIAAVAIINEGIVLAFHSKSAPLFMLGELWAKPETRDLVWELLVTNTMIAALGAGVAWHLSKPAQDGGQAS